MSLRISEFMTSFPISIDAEATLQDADVIMEVNGFRHLPVLREGKVIGIVSERDLKFALGLSGISLRANRVGEIVRSELYTVSPDTPLTEVARAMAARRIGSAVVLEDDEVIGIFTTTDALSVLSTLSEGGNNL